MYRDAAPRLPSLCRWCCAPSRARTPGPSARGPGSQGLLRWGFSKHQGQRVHRPPRRRHSAGTMRAHGLLAAALLLRACCRSFFRVDGRTRQRAQPGGWCMLAYRHPCRRERRDAWCSLRLGRCPRSAYEHTHPTRRPHDGLPPAPQRPPGSSAGSGDTAQVADCEARIIRCEVFRARLMSWRDGRDRRSPGAASWTG